MSSTSERLKKLQTDLISRDQALEKFKLFDGCQEVSIGEAKIKFDPAIMKDGAIHFTQGKDEFIMSKIAGQKLGRLVGISESYVEKVPPELMLGHYGFWLEKLSFKGIQQGKTGEGAGKIVNFMRKDDLFTTPSFVLRQVDKISTEYYLESSTDVGWRSSAFGIVFPKHEFFIKDDVEAGDYLYGGIKIKMSTIGEFVLRISAFLLTLVCTNGMISAKELFSFNRRTSSISQFIVDSVKLAIGALDKEVEQVKALKGVKIDSKHLSSYVMSLFDQMGINKRTREVLLADMVDKTPKDLYALMNVVTAAAHRLEHREDSYKVQSLGGSIVRHAASCPSCHRPV